MIRIENLSRSFGNIHAVNNLNLEVNAGEVFGFLGPNGCGKTTSIHLILGLIAPDAGRVELFGQNPIHAAEAVRKRCGILLEHDGLYERLTVLDNLMFSGRAYGLSKAETNTRCREVLEELELWDRRHDKAGTWSRGMKRRLAVGRAFLHRPELVFLDEPTSGFDPKAAHDLRAFMKRLAKQDRTTVFMTTHNMQEAERTCDRVAVVRAGSIIADGPPKSLGNDQPTLSIRGEHLAKLFKPLSQHPEVTHVAVTADGLELTIRDKAAPVVKFIVQKGGEVEEVMRVEADLEDTFLKLLEDE